MAVLRHPGAAGGLPRGRGDRRSAFPRQRAGDGAMPAPGDAAGRGDGRGLPGDLARAAARRVARPGRAGQSAETAEALAGAAPRSRMSGGRRRGGACRRRRSGRPCGGGRAGSRGAEGAALRSQRPCRRALPLLFRRRARLPYRQRQPSAAGRKPPALAYLDADRRASARSKGRSEAVFAFIDAATGQRWNLRPNRGAAAVVDLAARATGPGHPRRRLSRRAGTALRRPVGDGRRGAGSRSAGCSAGCGSRSPSPR